MVLPRQEELIRFSPDEAVKPLDAEEIVAITFVGRRHFDDPDLAERNFRRTGTLESSR